MKKDIEKVKVSADIEVNTKIAMQEYADLFCDGNFSQAFRQLIKKGLNYDRGGN